MSLDSRALRVATRASLLRRLRAPQDQEAWSEFYDIYAPLLYRFARRRGLATADAEEIRDQCLEIVTRRMPDFDYDRDQGRFRSWLFTIAHGRIVDLQRLRRPSRLSTAEQQALPDHGPAPQAVWEAEWRHEHLRFAMERARLQVSARTWATFEELLQGRAVPDICADRSINRNQVYKARGRVLAAIRTILHRLDGEPPSA